MGHEAAPKSKGVTRANPTPPATARKGANEPGPSPDASGDCIVSSA